MIIRTFILALACALSSCAPRGVRLPHDPALDLAKLAREAEGSNSLFKSYTSHSHVRWNQGWTWKLDLSGVAWDRSNTVTAISPRHVVMASHYPRKAGQEVVFHDRRSRRHVRNIERVVHFRDVGVNADVAVGLLNRPLPSSVRWYPVAAPRADGGSGLAGRTVLVTDQHRNLFFHVIDLVQGSLIRLRFDPDLPARRSKSLVTGDSGNPSFLLEDRELVLVETHTGGGAGIGPYYGSTDVQQALRRIMEDLDGRYPFQTVRVD